jgi:hypothetical protein
MFPYSNGKLPAVGPNVHDKLEVRAFNDRLVLNGGSTSLEKRSGESQVGGDSVQLYNPVQRSIPLIQWIFVLILLGGCPFELQRAEGVQLYPLSQGPRRTFGVAWEHAVSLPL